VPRHAMNLNGNQGAVVTDCVAEDPPGKDVHPQQLRPPIVPASALAEFALLGGAGDRFPRHVGAPFGEMRLSQLIVPTSVGAPVHPNRVICGRVTWPRATFVALCGEMGSRNRKSRGVCGLVRRDGCEGLSPTDRDGFRCRGLAGHAYLDSWLV
jgi:hypothetical protein